MEIVSGLHTVSIDPIVHTEYFAARRVNRDKEAVFTSIMVFATLLALTEDSCRLAAGWLGRLDRDSKRRHFNDALIAAVAVVEDAVLVTADKRIARVFPVTVFDYRR